jgi:hypothetical protein
MRVDFYTLECRVFGQAKRAQTRRERTALTKPRRAGMGSLKTLAVFGESVATHATVTKNRLGWMQSAETQYEAVVTYCEYWVYVLCAVMSGFPEYFKKSQKTY